MTTAQGLSDRYGEFIYDGKWHGQARQALEAFFEDASEMLTGSVTIKVQAGLIKCLSTVSPYSLYDTEQTSFEVDKQNINSWATGFVKTLSLSSHQQGLQAAKKVSSKEVSS